MTELDRIIEIVDGFITPLCKCDSCNTARLIATAIKMSQPSDTVDALGDDNGND